MMTKAQNSGLQEFKKVVEQVAKNAGIKNLPPHFKSCTLLNGKIDCESVEKPPNEYILAIYN